MFTRNHHSLTPFLKKGKVLIIYGPRQVGKTTLLENYLKTSPLKYRLESGENIRIQNLLNSKDFTQILDFVSGYELIAIDEAQEIPEIGAALKIITDQSPETLIIATGSSSFELSQQVGEPLTGRKNTIILYPIAQKELAQDFNKHDLREKLNDFLIFGAYPEVLTAENRNEKIKVLSELVDSYLLRDIMSHERIRSPKVLVQLLKLLAFQVGSQVSLNELATQLHVDMKTVERYLHLLEKSFVIKKFGGFSGNLRNEVTSKAKYYFLDNGMRNGLISQFNSLEDRNDAGALFENFVIMERLKKHSYENFYGNHFFWRTYDGKEIDLIEEIDGKLSAFEIKLGLGKKVKVPKAWEKGYPNSTFTVINRENYLDYLL